MGNRSGAFVILIGIAVVGIILGTSLSTSPQTTSQNKAQGAELVAAKNPQLLTKERWVRGNKEAKVILVEFSDFECPACGSAVPAIEQLLKDYPNDLKIVYRHFPLTNIHKSAQKAAEAGEAAGEQGKFWEMHDKLFQNQDKLSVDDLKKYAGEIGLNVDEFSKRLEEGAFEPQVREDASDAEALGISATPTFFIDGKEVTGISKFSDLKDLIDQELKK